MTTLNSELFQLAMSEKAKPLLDLVNKHIKENVVPISEEFFALHKEKEDRWKEFVDDLGTKTDTRQVWRTIPIPWTR